MGKYFYFSRLPFDFEAQKVGNYSYLFKNKLRNETFPFLFISISSSFLHKEMLHTKKFKILKSCCNTFHPRQKFFIFCRMFIWLSLAHSKQKILEKNFRDNPPLIGQLKDVLCFKIVQNFLPPRNDSLR